MLFIVKASHGGIDLDYAAALDPSEAFAHAVVLKEQEGVEVYDWDEGVWLER